MTHALFLSESRPRGHGKPLGLLLEPNLFYHGVCADTGREMIVCPDLKSKAVSSSRPATPKS